MKEQSICSFISFVNFANLYLTKQNSYCMIVHVPIKYVSVAQLDRASDYGSEGRVFESCHSQMKAYIKKYTLFCFIESKEKGRQICRPFYRGKYFHINYLSS